MEHTFCNSAQAAADAAFFDAVASNPVIAAVKDDAGLERCLQCQNIRIVFVLYGDVCTIGEIVARIKDADKIAMVHIDLVVGLANKEVSVDFLQKTTRADGVISTRQATIRRARELGMYAILRVFVVDSIALSSLTKLDSVHPNFIDILPGTMPKTLRRICALTHVPILTGGLISDKEDVITALQAGAVAISSTNEGIWEL